MFNMFIFFIRYFQMYQNIMDKTYILSKVIVFYIQWHQGWNPDVGGRRLFKEQSITF